MPIFEYECGGCRERFERLVARAAEPPPRCPRCASAEVVRVPSAFAVVHPGASASPGPCGSAECACRASQRPQ